MGQVIDLKKVKAIHFVGVGGIGISAMARLMLKQRKKVSGSDRVSSPITSALKKMGVRFYLGHREANLNEKTDLVVYTIAAPAGNPELTKARRLKIPTLSYPEMLGLVSADCFTIAVSGTHGKTTTTAMIGKIFKDAKLDPTVVVGSLMAQTKSNLIVGRSKYFIAEACEYRRSFLNLNPRVIVITNIDYDHPDYYKNISEVQKAFGEFVSKLGRDSYLVLNRGEKSVVPIVKRFKGRVIDYRAVAGKTALSLRVPGRHNIENAEAALAVAEIAGIPRKTALRSLEGFKGTWRRFEYKGKTKSGALVYDDYAHHPTEIKATLSAARELMDSKKKSLKRLTVVFQPHLYSRTKLLFKDFTESFGRADKIIVAPIYAAREKEDKAISGEKLAKAIKNKGKEAIYLSDFKKIEGYLKKNSTSEDLIITMGAGDIYKVSEVILKN
ncbi:MAG TPA: UDP-N-acetylmuramate--L-alanine ligase [Candidatus Tyrphobacter sp.]|nr:UDP-N-acetylmuramate--L-alanine ligase [Candidatus Tyrphobacter sp.]